ncbi:hypothetical protein [Roseibium sp.]|uniref:hypothetical protein n=1 Tax=Roseibium sp. TaxID=1936156 RepID=UPI003A96CAE9
MPTVQQVHYCTRCEHRTLHLQQTPNHILHLLLSLVTSGLWLLVWVGLRSSKPQRTQCGRRQGILDAMVDMAETHRPGSTRLDEDLDNSVMYQLRSLLRSRKRR